MIERNTNYSMIRVESWRAFHLVKFDIKSLFFQKGQLSVLS